MHGQTHLYVSLDTCLPKKILKKISAVELVKVLGISVPFCYERSDFSNERKEIHVARANYNMDAPSIVRRYETRRVTNALWQLRQKISAYLSDPSSSSKGRFLPQHGGSTP